MIACKVQTLIPDYDYEAFEGLGRGPVIIAIMPLYLRVGVLAAMIAMFVLLPHGLIGLEFEA